jgi:putative restriction endonuclease
MEFWVGVTNNSWFEFLAEKKADEVNFWQPSERPPFIGAPIDMPFLFKLKRPNNHIAGGGFFVTYSRLPVALAWEVFGEKNGAASLEQLLSLLQQSSGGNQALREIGCTVLANCFYFEREQWLADPLGFANNVVVGKRYRTEAMDGDALWAAVAARLQMHHVNDATRTFGYGDGVWMRPRLGQGAFRVLVTDAYERRCAITGENTLVALEAAHIVPYAKEQSHDVRNGLLLRADFHRLFDVGLVSVSGDMKIKVSPRIRETWFNGKNYYRLNDRRLAVTPTPPELRPDPDRLDWHYRNVFQS